MELPIGWGVACGRIVQSGAGGGVFASAGLRLGRRGGVGRAEVGGESGGVLGVSEGPFFENHLCGLITEELGVKGLDGVGGGDELDGVQVVVCFGGVVAFLRWLRAEECHATWLDGGVGDGGCVAVDGDGVGDDGIDVFGGDATAEEWRWAMRQGDFGQEPENGAGVFGELEWVGFGWGRRDGHGR